MQMLVDRENRNTKDTPLSELDCELFTEFYYDFLGKKENDKVAFLKTLTLLRQGQYRPFVHSVIAARKLTESLLPTLIERDIILTFPSILANFWHTIMEYRGRRAPETKLVVEEVRELLAPYWLKIARERDELNDFLRSLRCLQPKDKLEMAITFANTAPKKQGSELGYHLLIVVLIDHPFICVLPASSPNRTLQIGRLRSYIEPMIKSRGIEVTLEFFTVGGAKINKADHLRIGGEDIVFDVTFNNPKAPYSTKVMENYRKAKFNLITEVLTEEFPAETIEWDMSWL